MANPQETLVLNGVSTVGTTCTSGATSIVLQAGTGSRFTAPGRVVCESEVIYYTGISTDTLTGCARGQEGTSAAGHNAGTNIAQVLTPAGILQYASKLAPEVTFANLPTGPSVGTVANISDSNTITWGATIAGGSTNHVLGRWNGTNWTVVGI